MRNAKNIAVKFLGAASVVVMAGAAAAEENTPVTAGAVMTEMTSLERVHYLGGIVEGLAYARFEADGQQSAGMKCIYDWYYRNPDNLELVHGAMNRWPDLTPGAIMGVILNKACPR